MTLREAAVALGVSKSTVHRLVVRGELGYRRVGRRVVISPGHVAAFHAREQAARALATCRVPIEQLRADWPGLFRDGPATASPRRTRRTQRTAQTEARV